MKFERSQPTTSEHLAAGFKELREAESPDSAVFSSLEGTLSNRGYSLANEADVHQILSDATLLCRSEHFTRVTDLLTEDIPIRIESRDGGANMCQMYSGEGFKTAMSEGFSGKDVGGAVKVVITFHGNNLHAQEKIAATHSLWSTKPKTAQVSISGSGLITTDDVAMLSFRFPIRYFPEHLLTEEEQDRLAHEGISFIVRHYVPQKEKATH